MAVKNNLIRAFVLGALLIFVMVLGAQTIGLFRTGFDTTSVLQQFNFYIGPGISFLIGIMFLIAAELMLTKNDKYGNSVCFNSPGEAPSVFKLSNLQLVLGSILLFGILGLILVSTGMQSFTGIGSLEQQFTVVDELVYSSALVPASENLGAAFALAFFLTMWRYVCKKTNIDKGTFIVVSVLLGLVVVAGFGYTWHTLRYADSDVRMNTVLGFWAAGGLLTVLTGSFIPFWIMHITNNLFYGLGQYFDSDIVLGSVGAVLAVVAILLIFVSFRGGKKRGKR